MQNSRNIWIFRLACNFCFLLMPFFIFAGEHQLAIKSQPLLSNRAVLEEFFRFFVKDSEAGYVLFGEKPICFFGYAKHNLDTPGTAKHRENTLLLKGIKAWEKFQSTNSDSNYAVVVEEGKEKWLSILFVNKGALETAINDNLVLFQYILGPTVTAKSLLNRILNPNENFFSIFKFNKVLIGIVLGFGVQNALHASRQECLADSLFMPVKAPFKPFEEIAPFSKEQQLMIDSSTGLEEYFHHHNLQPNFGFKSLKEEHDDLEEKLTVSSPALLNQKPRFFYGGLKNQTENLKLISRLEREQKRVIEVIESEDFLNKILDKLQISKSNSSNQGFFALSNDSLDELVAKNIWGQLLELELIHPFQIDLLINGMESANGEMENSLKIQEDYSEALASYFLAKKIFLMQKTYQNLDSFFETLAKEPNHQSIIPKKLLYSIVIPGDNKKLNKENRVLIQYHIVNLQGKEVSTASEWVDLNETIYGFSEGLKDMQLNEVRKIYIHPDIGYGTYTSGFEKGAGLIATVKLMDIDSTNLRVISETASEPILDRPPSLSEEEFLNSQKNYLWNLGVILGYHYKQIEGFTKFKSIIERIQQFSNNHLKFSSLNEEEEQILNHLDYLIYKRS